MRRLGQMPVLRDEVLKAGQTVRVVRTVSIAVDMRILDLPDGSGFADMTVEELITDIEDNTSIPDMLDEYPDAEIVDISVEITEIN